MSRPPLDTPNFDGLGHEAHRAYRVRRFLRRNHGKWFTSSEIAEGTGLAESTVESALSRIFGLPPAFRPRLQRHVIEDESGKTKEYRFAKIVEMIFERNER